MYTVDFNYRLPSPGGPIPQKLAKIFDGPPSIGAAPFLSSHVPQEVS